MFSKGNQGSLIAHPTQECLQLPHLHPPISGPSPKRHQGMGGAGGAPRTPSPRASIVFSKVQVPHFPCSAWHPSGKQPWTCCRGSLSHPAPSGMFPHPLLQISLGFPAFGIAAGAAMDRGPWSMVHGQAPQEVTNPTFLPKTALPCHGDAALGPRAGKVLAGCHSPVQNHRRLASECCSMSNLPRRAKSQDTDLQILL